MSDDGPEWFAPKRYGYGSGLPLTWQGWAVMVGFLVIVFVDAIFFASRPIILIAILIPAVVALTVLTARTTRGGWRWRWGEDD